MLIKPTIQFCSKAKDQDETKRLLQIIVGATRPLRVEEIGVAIFITEDTQAYQDLELQKGKQLETTIRMPAVCSFI
jgi:hypothetical protein